MTEYLAAGGGCKVVGNIIVVDDTVSRTADLRMDAHTKRWLRGNTQGGAAGGR